VVVVLLLCELFCMFVRHHFINLIAYLSVLAIYCLSYFEASYIKAVLGCISVAGGADVGWLLLHSKVPGSNSALLVARGTDPLVASARGHLARRGCSGSHHSHWQGNPWLR
jgi:hypothetical protein